MLFRAAALLTVLTVAAPAVAEYRTASTLLDAMREAQQTRAEGVSDYAMDLTLMQERSTQYFERTQDDGTGLEVFRLVPFDEVRRRLRDEPGAAPPDSASSSGTTETGPGTGSWGLGDSDRMSMLMQRAAIVGRESVDGKSAYLVKADDLNLTEVSDGAEIVIRSIALWVDVEDLVMLKTHMDGVLNEDGQSRAIFIEKLDHDYRSVPGTRMILPYRSVMRMGGMLGPKEQKEMEEARKQLAEFDRQMESMPPDKKAMMQSMMGSQMETYRKMIDQEVLEVETIVREIRVNQGIAGAYARTPAVAPGSKAVSVAKAGSAQPEPDARALQQARDACLQQKVAEAQSAKKKKKRFGSLIGAVGRVAGRHGSNGLAADVSRVSSDIYDAEATTEDLEVAAEALGITTDDVAACENPE